MDRVLRLSDSHRTWGVMLAPALAWLLICSACDHDDNSPYPNAFETHAHTVIVRFRTINLAADTIGVRSFATSNGRFLARRDAGKLSRNSVDPGWLGGPVQLLYPDSEVHACTTEVQHFAGYQREYGGDTSRFGAMDRYGLWEMRMLLTGNEAVLAGGETVGMTGFPLYNIPDTVRQNGQWELDITWDVDGLLEWNQDRTAILINAEHVSVTER